MTYLPYKYIIFIYKQKVISICLSQALTTIPHRLYITPKIRGKMNLHREYTQVCN